MGSNMTYASTSVGGKLLIVLTILSTGCAARTDRGYWGSTVSWPDGQRLRESALAAVRNPQTWVPLAGAAVIGLADLDDEISDWAVEESPVFGDNAADASDSLRSLTSAAYWVTALVAPSDSIAAKLKGLSVGAATLVIEEATVNAMKSLSGRERPTGFDDKSFPSGHASRASVSAAMAAGNLEYTAMPGWVRGTLQVGLYGAAAGTGWARVEAGKHYPTDVLVGYAIGQFLARFMHEAFFAGTDENGSQMQALSYRPMPGGGELTVSLRLH